MAGETPRGREAPVVPLLRGQPVIELDDLLTPPVEEEEEPDGLPGDIVTRVGRQVRPAQAPGTAQVQLAEGAHQGRLPAGPLGRRADFGCLQGRRGAGDIAGEERGKGLGRVRFGTRRVQGGGGGEFVPRPGQAQEQDLGAPPVAGGRIRRGSGERQATAVVFHPLTFPDRAARPAG